MSVFSKPSWPPTPRTGGTPADLSPADRALARDAARVLRRADEGGAFAGHQSGLVVTTLARELLGEAYDGLDLSPAPYYRRVGEPPCTWRFRIEGVWDQLLLEDS